MSLAVHPRLAVALGLWAFGVFLRLADLDLMELKGDEVQALLMADALAEAGRWPKVGLISSVGIPNPPAFIYLLALPRIFSDDPVVITGFIAVLSCAALWLSYEFARRGFGERVALLALAFQATAPWAVLYARKIWAQDLLPLAVIALWFCLLRVAERGRTWAWAGIPPLLGLLWQLHFSGYAAIFAAGIWLVLMLPRLRVHWAALGAGIGLAGALFVPYAWHLIETNFADIQTMLALMGTDMSAMVLPEYPGIEKRPFWVLPFDVLSAGGFDFVLSITKDVFDAQQGQAYTLSRYVTKAVTAAGAVGLAMAVRRALRGFARVPSGWRFAWRDEALPYVLVTVWAVAPFVLYTAGKIYSYPHYYIITFPAGFIMVALAWEVVAERLGSFVGPRWGWPAVLAAAAAIVVLQAGFFVRFNRLLETEGGTFGDYGVAYRHKHDVAVFLARYAHPTKAKIGWDLSLHRPLDFVDSYILQKARARERPRWGKKPLATFAIVDRRWIPNNDYSVCRRKHTAGCFVVCGR